MLFNSYIFIFLFLPLCLVGFYILQNRRATLAKVWLTCFSLWFYGYFNLSYLMIMLCSIVGNYLIHCVMIQTRKSDAEKEKRKISRNIMITGVLANLSVLFYFKYYDFFLDNVNALFGSSFPLKNILLPLGISFFTFQQISFVVDTYRGELEQVSFVDYALFVSFFPQLIAGPIVVHEEMLPQFATIGSDKRSKEEKTEIFTKGIYVFVLGMAKKVLIADTFGIAVDMAYNNVNGINGFESLITVVFYSLQLYFDFSGYCDMAKGIAGMFGMHIANNFNSPYKASNIVEFWKRWHITLSRFFTRNIYIPLGGNRNGEIRMYINYMIVFFLSGLWHGAGWNFILWGILHGGLYVATKWWLRHKKETSVINRKKNDDVKNEIERNDVKNTGVTQLSNQSAMQDINRKSNVKKQKVSIGKIVSRILTFCYVSVAWVYFRSASVEQANTLLMNIFTKPWALPGNGFTDAFNLGEFWYILKILKVAALPYAQYYIMFLFSVVALLITFFGRNIDELAAKFKPGILNATVTSVIFIWCVVSLSGVSTFLYFNF